jgi:hypothetical protein
MTARVSKVIDGEPKPFEVTNASWSRVEKTYKRKIPPTVRSEITHAISVYLFKLQSATSPSVANAEKRIESIYAHSRELLNVCTRRTTEGSVLGEMLVGLRFNQLWNDRDAASNFARVIMVATALTEGCILARTDLRKWNQGKLDPWDGWTDAITRILAKAGMPKGISKSKNTRSLPFVDLIAGLQNLLPKGARKHGKTRDSLVQALWRARKRMREERKRREKARQRRIVEKERLSRLAYGRNRRVDTR